MTPNLIPPALEEAIRPLSALYFGTLGEWGYRAFDFVNARFHEGRLPTPLITWGITPHGGCLGLTSSPRVTPPVILLHPSLFGGKESTSPWGIPPEWLGPRYAFDVLFHECIHIAVHYVHGGHSGPTSHNNPVWIAEVNRLAPLLGFEGIEAGRSKTKRIKGEDGKLSKVVRASEGNLPHSGIATFPYGVRKALGTADGYYRSGRSPLEEAEAR